MQSRYYDFNTCKFINADDPSILLSDPYNTQCVYIYDYCNNNPVMFEDPTGRFGAIAIAGIYFIAAITVTLCSSSILTSSSFKRGWCQFCDSIAIGASRVANGISSGISWIQTKSKAIAKSVGDSFSRIRVRPRYRSSRELHHVVAQNDHRAWIARSILSKVNIKINSSANTIYIKTGVHRRLHLKIYYEYVNDMILSGYNKGKNYTQRRNKVLLALARIKNTIQAIEAVSPF